MDAVLEEVNLIWIPSQVHSIAEHCNDRKSAAKNVSEKSDELFLGLFIRESGPLLVDAIVIQVMDHAMDCILQDMAVVKRVYLDRNVEIESYEYQRVAGKLSLGLKWKSEPRQQMLSMFSRVQLSLETHSKSSFDFNATLLKPNNESVF